MSYARVCSSAVVSPPTKICAIISARMAQQTETFDAIVVGSGISGGWAAKELTERGLRVLMLERGKNVEHRKDYPNARKAPWEYRIAAAARARWSMPIPCCSATIR
jgi:NAD(P)-binding Rossmann-like domain